MEGAGTAVPGAVGVSPGCLPGPGTGVGTAVPGAVGTVPGNPGVPGVVGGTGAVVPGAVGVNPGCPAGAGAGAGVPTGAGAVGTVAGCCAMLRNVRPNVHPKNSSPMTPY